EHDKEHSEADDQKHPGGTCCTSICQTKSTRSIPTVSRIVPAFLTHPGRWNQHKRKLPGGSKNHSISKDGEKFEVTLQQTVSNCVPQSSSQCQAQINIPSIPESCPFATYHDGHD